MEKKALLQINNTESQLHINTALPTSPPLGAGIRSTYDKERWQEDENRDGVYMEISKANPSNRVEILISGEKDGEILALEASRQVIDLIGLDAAKIQLVFAAHLFNKINQSNYQNDYFNSKFTLRGRDVIQQIGWDNRKRTNTSEKLAELASIAFHLGRMLIRCTWIEGNKKGSKVDASIDISPLWVININAKGKMDVRSANIDNPEDVYITFKKGVEVVIDETEWFIKWVAAEIEPEQAEELVNIQVQLARWQLNLNNILSSELRRTETAQIAETYSLLVLNMSGLLDSAA